MCKSRFFVEKEVGIQQSYCAPCIQKYFAKKEEDLVKQTEAEALESAAKNESDAKSKLKGKKEVVVAKVAVSSKKEPVVIIKKRASKEYKATNFEKIKGFTGLKK